MTFFNHDEAEKKTLDRYIIAVLNEDLANVSDLETSKSFIVQVPRRMEDESDASWQARKKTSGFEFPDNVKVEEYGKAVVLHQHAVASAFQGKL